MLKKSSKTALGGIVAALSVSIMFMVSIVPFLTYALPAAAAALLIPVIVEINKKWALGVYLSVSILSLLFLPNKEVAVIYTAFFGYYPILKSFLESHMKKPPELILKLIIFNGAITVSYYLMMKFMGITIDELDNFGTYAVPILLGFGTVAFILYDYSLTKIISLYLYKWQRQFRKMFK